MEYTKPEIMFLSNITLIQGGLSYGQFDGSRTSWYH